MPLQDDVKDRRNKILIRGGSAVGLILSAFAVYTFVRPALQIEQPDGDVLLTFSDHGAIGVQSGRGVAFGSNGDCLKSGGSSGSTMTFGTCGGGTGGGGNWSGTGALQNQFDNRYVNTSGDTMTGSLVVQNGTVHTPTGNALINTRGTISGVTLYANSTLRSSGSIVAEGAISGASLFIGTSIRGSGLTDCDTSTTSKLFWDTTTGRFSCGTDQNTVTSIGQGLGITAGVLTLNTSNSGSLSAYQTQSGSTVYGSKSLRSSGSLVFEGAASGSSLYLGTSLNGAGLVSCSSATTSKLLWNSASGRFSCGADTDTDTNTTYTAGGNLTLTNTSFSLNATVTGSVIKASNSLNSSGTLVVEGAMSGASLYVGTSIKGAGLVTDCDTAGTSKLLWDTTTGRFSCGTDTDTNTTYTAGQNLALNGTSFSLNTTITGSLLEFSTVSGTTVYGNQSVRSSGAIVAEGTISGANLYAGTSIKGAGLVIDCDTAGTSKLLWDATTGRFSCGTDTDTNTTYSAGQGLTLTSTSFKTNATQTGTLAAYQTLSGTVIKSLNSLNSSGTLVVEGAMSGASLYVGTFIKGAGLVNDCDTAGTSKLLWDATTGRFSCGTDQTGASAPFNTGNVILVGDARYVKKAGDTMTGTLVIQNGNTHSPTGTALLNIRGVMSGITLYANTAVRSSGSMIATGNIATKATLSGAGLTIMNGNSYLFGNTTIGSSTAADTKLEVVGTISGSTVYANAALRSSGSITAEGTISGANLYAGTSIKGAGLAVDCDTAGTSKLLWDVSTGRFSCGTDTDTNTTYTAGQGLTLNGTSFSLTAAHSGTIIKATTTLASSGTIVGEGNISGATLNIGGVAKGGTFSGSIMRSGLYSVSPVTIEVVAAGTGTALTVGSGKILYVIPRTMSGFKVFDAAIYVAASGTTNTTNVHIRNFSKGNRKIFSTPPSIDSTEKSSDTGATPFVISNANSDVSGGDYIFVDISTVSTTAPKGLNIILYLYKP